ncbi:MAG TPA: M14 family metallopeptidase [Stellaceae bacterium]|jgi:hypothetical protein
MREAGYFPADYTEARRRFREAATAAGAVLGKYDHPAPGPAGEALTTDTAWLGPREASRVLVTFSSTHGVEGFAGSGIQVGWFESGLAAATLPAGTALLAVHAINPHGFAWLRRVTHENVDLNRNFVDFAAPLPRNPGYDELADAICPRDWSEASRAAAQAVLEAYALRHGAAALQKALSGGQYTHPDGVFFGGAAPTWSRRTVERIVDEHLRDRRSVAVIDFHTGLGPYGYGEAIVMHRDGSAALARARRWYGEERVTSPLLGSSTSADLSGDMLSALERMLAVGAGIEFTGMALEFGTLPLQQVADALRADNWLHLHGDPASPEGRRIKAQIRDALYCDRDDWKSMLFEQGADAQRRALDGLAAS